MKKSVKYLDGKTVTIEVDVKFATLFENFLLYYISNADDSNDVITAYKKIESIVKKTGDVKLTEFETYLYCLTALCQNLKRSAIEQDVAIEFEIPDEVAAKSKQVASMILKNQGKNSDELKSLYNDLLNDFNNL